MPTTRYSKIQFEKLGAVHQQAISAIKKCLLPSVKLQAIMAKYGAKNDEFHLSWPASNRLPSMTVT
jgi:hypothetical protein